MERIILCFVVFMCLSGSHTFAQNQTQEEVIHFQLFTNCEPISLRVGELSSDGLKIGLTRKSIKNVVESRLRSAHLYSNKLTDSYLSIDMRVTGGAFSITLSLHKGVYDPLFTRSVGYAPTWSNGFLGTHGAALLNKYIIRDVKALRYVMSNLSEVTDDFLVEFLRVNDEACRKKR